MVLLEKMNTFSLYSFSCDSASASFDGCVLQRSCLQMFAYVQHKPVLTLLSISVFLCYLTLLRRAQ